MSDVAHPELICLVREAKGWTQKQLAEEAGLTQGYISKIEGGVTDLRGEQLEKVAAALECPMDLLTDDTPIQGLEVTCLHHPRRHTTMTARNIRQIQAVTHLTRVSVEGLMGGLDLQPALPLHRLDPDAHLDAPGAARTLRAEWQIPPGPVRDITALLEAAGVVVVERSLGTRGQDAVSTWPAGEHRPPVMLLNAGLATDRRRFTMSHELGHLVMHHVPGPGQEEEANEFASEFLAPADEIRPELMDLTTRDFPRLLKLKAHWGMSVASLIRRAHDLDTITDRQYREFQIQLGRLGWRTSEPGTLPPEYARTLSRAVQLRRDKGFTETDLAKTALMTRVAFHRHYGLADPTLGTIHVDYPGREVTS